MRIVILGPAGSGKGTQGTLISKKLNIPLISIGDLVRRETKKHSTLAQKVAWYSVQGLLVPDEIIIKLLVKRLKATDCKNGFILDGFPRNLNQAIELDKLIEIDKVILIKIDNKTALSRIQGRFVCSNCGLTLSNDINTDLKCISCGGTMIKRKDDLNENAIKTRLNIYENNIKPIISHYKNKGILFEVSGEKSKTEVFEQISQVVTE